MMVEGIKKKKKEEENNLSYIQFIIWFHNFSL